MKNTIVVVLILSACSITKQQDKPINVPIETIPDTIPSVTGKPIPPYKPLQSFNGDTLQYIQKNLLDRKEAYIQRELSVLLKDFEIPIKKYTNGMSGNSLEVSPDISLRIYDYTTEDHKIKNKENPAILVIRWKDPLNMSSLIPLLKRTRGNWTSEAEDFYSKQIISDVSSVRFN